MTNREIFLRAQELSSPADRARYLDRVCGDDDDLRAEIESLLAFDREDDFLEVPPVDGPCDPTIGSQIGPYKILQEIGEGGMGVVYMAEQRQPIQRRVALKIIKVGMDTRQVIARFEAERQALAMMDHPNIAKIIDAGETEAGRPYFVMELVRGTSLTEFCDENGLATSERLELFQRVCRGIHHAHQKGIIHRDIKPTNVLVTAIDGEPVPKIIDFGIAKAINVRLTEKTLFTEFQRFMGTPIYVSPEQMEMSGQDMDTRSDIYSLGVLLYELLTGSTPLERNFLQKAAYAEIERAVKEVEPPWPSTRLSTLGQARLRTISRARGCEPRRLFKLVRGDLDWIVMKAIEKDRSRRYESAFALAEDVERFLADEAVGAVRPSMRYRMGKFARRNKGLLAAGGLVAGALVLGTVVSVWQANRANQEAEERGQEARRAREAGAEALVQARRAEAGEGAARRNLYLADMNFAQDAVENGNVERAIEILERHLPARGQEDLRHFEWRYLWKQTHRELFSLLIDDDPDDALKPDPIFDLAVSGRGDLLATASRVGRIRVWNLTTRSEILQFDIDVSGAAWVDISPTGTHVAAAGRTGDGRPSEVVVWDLVRRKQGHRLDLALARCSTGPQFAADGTLVVGCNDGTVRFWNLESGERAVVDAHVAGVTACSTAFSAPEMVTLGRDAIMVWNVAKHKVTASHPNERNYRGATISHDGRWLAVHTMPVPLVAVLDARSGREEAVLHVDHPIKGAHFSPDRSMLAVAEISGAIRVFETGTWREITTYQHRGYQLNSLAYSHDGAMIVSGGDSGVIAAWPGSPDLLGVFASIEGWVVTALAYSPAGQVLAVGYGDGRVEIRDADTHRLLFSTPEQSGQRGIAPAPPFDDDFFAISPDGRQLALSAEAGVEFWDLPGGEQTDRPLRHEARVRCVAYSPNGRLLATGSMKKGTIQVWDRESREVIQQFQDGGGVVECLAFSPNSRLLVSEGWGALGLHVWDVTSGNCIATLKGHTEPSGDNHSVQFSPDGALLATAGYDSKVILWDTKTWQLARTLLGHSAILADLSFSADGKRLASSGVDNLCKLWDVATGQEVASFRGFTVDFCPDGGKLAIGGDYHLPADEGPPAARTVRVYRAPTLEEIDAKYLAESGEEFRE